jgi:WD40 repeat protein
VFRDREDLAGAPDLPERIQEALRESRYLIVICSPNAARSRWVNEEIKAFKALGHESRVLALIVDGEPNASDDPISGFPECFPEGLRYRSGPAGQLTSERTEPLAADARAGKDGKRNALLKLIAGILGVRFDELRRRDQQRQAQRLRWITGLSLTAVAIFASIAWYANGQRLAAERQRSVAEERARIATSQKLAVQSDNALSEHPQRSALLAVAALQGLEANDPHVPVVEENLRHILSNLGGYGLSGHEGVIHAVAVSPDNRWLATGSADSTGRLWDLTGVDPGQTPIVLRGHEKAITTLAFSHDNKWLATGSWDRSIRLWSVHGEAPTAPAETLAEGRADPNTADGYGWPVWSAVVFSPDNRWLAAYGRYSPGYLWNLEHRAATPITTLPRQTRHEQNDEITSVAFSPDSRWLVAGHVAGVAQVLDLTAPPGSMPLIMHGHRAMVRAVAFSADSHWLITGSDDKTVRLWDLSAADPQTASIELGGHQGAIHAVAVSPDNRWLVTAAGSVYEHGRDNTVRLWKFTAPFQPAEPSILRGHQRPVTFVVVSPDSRWLVTASADSNSTVRGGDGEKVVRLWDLTSDDPAATPPIVLYGHDATITALAVSAHNWLATGSADHTARVWNLHAGNLNATTPPVFRGQTGAVSAVALSPDNHWLATASLAGSFQSQPTLLWDLTATVPATKPKVVLPGHIAGQRRGYATGNAGVAFSRDSRWLVTLSEAVSGEARLWDLTAGTLSANLSPLLLGHATAVAISRDSRWLVTASSRSYRYPLTGEQRRDYQETGDNHVRMCACGTCRHPSRPHTPSCCAVIRNRCELLP